MKIDKVPKLLSFLAKGFSFFFSQNHQKLVLLKKFSHEAKPSYFLVMFLMFSFLIVRILCKDSSQFSSDKEEFEYHSESIFPLELYPLSYKVDEEIQNEIYSKSNIVDDNDQDFVPRLVHLELIKGATGSHDDYDPSFKGTIIRCNEDNKLFL